jgi:mono/diheme cytochrome c family protein
MNSREAATQARTLCRFYTISDTQYELSFKEGDNQMSKQIFWILVLVGTLDGAASAWAQNAAEGKKLYTAYCSTCHGESGKGDGVAGASLPVKPADHTNGAVMNKLNDKFLQDIISKGGGAVGKSTFMPSWGGALNDSQVRDVVAYIRSLANPPSTPTGR